MKADTFLSERRYFQCTIVSAQQVQDSSCSHKMKISPAMKAYYKWFVFQNTTKRNQTTNDSE